jgi:hypothetical protein
MMAILRGDSYKNIVMLMTGDYWYSTKTSSTPHLLSPSLYSVSPVYYNLGKEVLLDGETNAWI